MQPAEKKLEKTLDLKPQMSGLYAATPLGLTSLMSAVSGRSLRTSTVYTNREERRVYSALNDSLYYLTHDTQSAPRPVA